MLTWKQGSAEPAEKKYREANGGSSHERWIQEPINSRHGVVITRHYETIGTSVFVRPVQPPAIGAELARWHAMGASAFRDFETSLDALE